ncbi:MAG: hypothetical protein JXD22_15530 [Sedimentisphaerales bacterium]|nr:hypothetical protein [Sedimentisphaerales bacterium]
MTNDETRPGFAMATPRQDDELMTNSEVRKMNIKRRNLVEKKHRLKSILQEARECLVRLLLSATVGFLLIMLFCVVASYGAEGDKEAVVVKETKAKKEKDSVGVDEAKVAALKAAILKKDIFSPAKVTSVPLSVDVNETEVDTGPKALKRPFRVIGIQSTEEGRLVDLYFENPPEVAQKKVGEVIEKTVTILAIEATFLRCEYAGLEVRIEQGETSNDALERLRGLEESKYELIGTTLKEGGFVADIYLPRQDRTRRIEVGEILGEATVMKIEKGRVTLIDPDGNQITISNE